MNNSFFKNLIKRYNNGTATGPERFIVETWYSSFEDDQSELPGVTSAQESEVTRLRIFNRIAPEQTIKRVWYKSAWLRAAATICVLSALYSAYNARKQVDNLSKQAQNINLVYQTGQLEMKKILLNDSTVIWLNANSSISFPKTFGSKDRRLRLTGEANFEVQRDTLRPFIVDAGQIHIRVLGTAFNIQAYPKLESIKVSVSRGRVQVTEGQHQLALLIKNNGLVYHKENKDFKLDNRMVKSSTSWMDGRVQLEKGSYLELKQALFNLYGLNLNTSDKKVKSFKYNLTLRSTQTQKDALEMLMTMLNKKIKWEGSHDITIY